MKKNISINLQGIIFHIEEDGYEVLSRYLAEVKAHFASYRGHADIVADIEGRIAELFGARLSPTQQVITLADVEAMMAKMGRVSDFAADTDDDDETTAEAFTGAAGNSFGSASAAGAKSTFAPGPATAETGPRRLYRDMANRKMGGVAAGIAQYFSVNPLWVRLGFLAVFFLKPLLALMSFGFIDINGSPFGFAALVYTVLWVVLPKRYDAPVLEDHLNLKSLSGRKFYRDTDNGKVGGVAAGLAAYLRVDVTLVRLLLLAGLFAFGSTAILYIIFWIAAPQAVTVADKMRMRGDDMTLEGFDSNVRNSAFDAENGPLRNRPVGAFIEDLGRGLRPLVDFAGSFIRISAGLLLTIMGFSLLLALSIALGVGIGLIPNSEKIIFSDLPVHVLLNGIPTWGILAGFLTMAIPALSLLLAGLNLLLRHSLMNRTVSLSLLGLWLLSIVGLAMAFAGQSREFQSDAEVEEVREYPELTTPVLLLDEHSIDRHNSQWPNVRLAALDSGRAVQVLRIMSASGATETEARATASNSIAYNVRVSGDSSLVFDDHFSFQPNARYRDQHLQVVIRLPRNRTFRISQGFASLVGDDSFVNNRQPKDPEKYRYRLHGNKLECLSCPLEETNDDEDRDDEDVHINIDSDNDSNDDGDNNDEDDNDHEVNLNYGGAPSFSTDLQSYGADRRTFEEEGFSKVHVEGGYRVVIRQGSKFRIEAAGQGSELRDLRVEREGNELNIRPRRGGFLNSLNSNDDKVLISIEMPSVEDISLVGTVRADVAGFPRQERLQVEQAGASHLRLKGDFGSLEMELAGMCRTTAAGNVNRLELDGAGACELAAADLRATTADIDLAGASKARLQVTETIKADAVGACVIEYSGNPKNVDTDATGASRVKRLKD